MSPSAFRNVVLVRFERRTVLETPVDLLHCKIVGRHTTGRQVSMLRPRSSRVIKKMLRDDGRLILIKADELPIQVHLAHAMSVFADRRAVRGMASTVAP